MNADKTKPFNRVHRRPICFFVLRGPPVIFRNPPAGLLHEERAGGHVRPTRSPAVFAVLTADFIHQAGDVSFGNAHLACAALIPRDELYTTLLSARRVFDLPEQVIGEEFGVGQGCLAFTFAFPDGSS